ncbi:MAG: hypothetical protein HYT39_01870 [Candidatus Sungbacteria bacterium]|nr:hypothetical protein [Candidatus Sungbacteria bacterium]
MKFLKSQSPTGYIKKAASEVFSFENAWECEQAGLERSERASTYASKSNSLGLIYVFQKMNTE